MFIIVLLPSWHKSLTSLLIKVALDLYIEYEITEKVLYSTHSLSIIT